jgi:hypothetical protein
VLTCAARIAGGTYATSISGELLKRDRHGAWKRVAASLGDSGEMMMAVAGTKGHVWGVGSRVWQLRGKKWVPSHAPAGNYRTLTFHRHAPVTFADKTLVRGTDEGEGGWSVEQLDLVGPIHDVCSFQGELFVAADNQLHLLTAEALTPEQGPSSCTTLVTNGDVLVAASDEELHCYSSGRWSRVW